MSEELKDAPKLENLEILSVLGRGGMSVVYKAIQPMTGRIVAVKVLAHSLFDRTDALRFEREAKIMASVNHPGIASIFQFGTVPEPFIVMEYLEGGSLAERLSKGPLTPAQCVDVFLAICAALGSAHSVGIIHRDLKPGNIMFSDHSDDGAAKLVDFGIAKPAFAQSQTLTAEGHLIGSPAYMSPEQCSGEELDARSDIYSLCCVMFESVTGQTVFTGNNALEQMYLHKNSSRPSAEDLADKHKIPPALAHCIVKGLAIDKSQRWHSADELAQELPKSLSSSGTDRQFRWKPVMWLFGVASVALVAGVTAYGGFNPVGRGIFVAPSQSFQVLKRMPDNPEVFFEWLRTVAPELRSANLPIYTEAYDKFRKEEMAAFKVDRKLSSLHSALSRILRLQYLRFGPIAMQAEYRARLQDPKYKGDPFWLAHLKRAMAVEQLRTRDAIEPLLAKELLEFDDKNLGAKHQKTLWDLSLLLNDAVRNRSAKQVNYYLDRLAEAINGPEPTIGVAHREVLIQSLVNVVTQTGYATPDSAQRMLAIVDHRLQGREFTSGGEGNLWYLKSLCFRALKRHDEEKAALTKCVELSRPADGEREPARERLRTIRAAEKKKS